MFFGNSLSVFSVNCSVAVMVGIFSRRSISFTVVVWYSSGNVVLYSLLYTIQSACWSVSWYSRPFRNSLVPSHCKVLWLRCVLLQALGDHLLVVITFVSHDRIWWTIWYSSWSFWICFGSHLVAMFWLFCISFGTASVAIFALCSVCSLELDC